MTHATPRPWYWNHNGDLASDDEGQIVIERGSGVSDEDAALIVHAVNMLDEVKAEIRQAVRRLSDLTNDLEDAEYTGGEEAVANIAYCLDTVLVKLEQHDTHTT